jgi:hypothetical protein
MKVNTRKRKLKRIWRQLDEASGSLYNAIDNLARLKDLPISIKAEIERIDVSQITELKNIVEDIIVGRLQACGECKKAILVDELSYKETVLINGIEKTVTFCEDCMSEMFKCETCGISRPCCNDCI